MSLQSRLSDNIKALREAGVDNAIPEIGSPQGAYFLVDGKKMLNLCSNNYLGMANDTRLVDGAVQAINNWGVGPGAVRTIAGTQSIHIQLERELARFKGVNSVLLFQSGFCANLGTIPAIVDEKDTIFSDELNHASIIDGCRLSKAKVIRYPHCDVTALEKIIKDWIPNRCATQNGFIITDGVFSMDGDIAPLKDLAKVASKYDLALMVDDAHGEGVLGEQGRGVVDYFGLQGRVDIEIGTLSKAFGTLGGYVAGSEELCNWLKQRARPFLFSTGLAPAEVGATLVAIRMLSSSSELVDRLWENTRAFQSLLREYGFDLGSTKTPITPIYVYNEGVAKQFSSELLKKGIFIQSIVYPTVPKGKARLRAMVSVCHSEEDLQFAADAIRSVGVALGVIK